jgi:hypothetical protein
MAGRELELSFNHPGVRALIAEVELEIQRKPSKLGFAYGASTIDKVNKSGRIAEEVQPRVPISSLGASPSTLINILASSHNLTSERARTYENPSLGATSGQIMEVSNTLKRKRKREGDDPLQAGGCKVQSIIPTAKQTGTAPRALGSAKHQEPYANSRKIILPSISSLLGVKEPVGSMKWDEPTTD